MTEKTILCLLPDSGFVRQSDLLKIIPFSSTTLWRSAKSGKFPKPVKLTKRVVAWRVEEVRAWMQSRAAV